MLENHLYHRSKYFYWFQTGGVFIIIKAINRFDVLIVLKNLIRCWQILSPTSVSKLFGQTLPLQDPAACLRNVPAAWRCFSPTAPQNQIHVFFLLSLIVWCLNSSWRQKRAVCCADASLTLTVVSRLQTVAVWTSRRCSYWDFYHCFTWRGSHGKKLAFVGFKDHYQFFLFERYMTRSYYCYLTVVWSIQNRFYVLLLSKVYLQRYRHTKHV